MNPSPPLFDHPQGSTFEARRETLIDFFADRDAGGYIDRIDYLEIDKDKGPVRPPWRVD